MEERDKKPSNLENTSEGVSESRISERRYPLGTPGTNYHRSKNYYLQIMRDLGLTTWDGPEPYTDDGKTPSGGKQD